MSPPDAKPAAASGAGTALVTGASSGIGAVYAERLAARGHDLVLVARRRDRLEVLAERLHMQHGCHVEVVAADLADSADLDCVEALVREAPGLSLVANIAGSGVLAPATLVDPATVETMLKVNVVALTRLSLAAAKRFAAQMHGTIINISSIAAAMTVPGVGAYGGSKAYVLNLSRSLQAELAGKGVTVQAVAPGPVRSEFFGDGPAPFPDALFMSAEDLVDTALAALDQGETVTFPTLHDPAVWTGFDHAREALLGELVRTGKPAPRYAA